MEQLQSVQMRALQPHPRNPRHSIPADGIRELADSIREHGILTPLLVRPARNGHFEILAGHRRHLAAKEAGLESVPAIVRELDDRKALEVLVLENLQREDLHPLEEAEGFQILMREEGYAAEDIAAKLGKSKAYIYGRLKLTSLPEAAKKLFWQGSLTPSTALLVARIPDAKLAAQAAREISKGGRWGGDSEAMSYRRAVEWVQTEYMLRLKEAPFPTDDADLVPKAGPCSSCPKRTGNQPELFGDVKSADVCTDPTCYRKKTDAWGAIQIQEAKSQGLPVLGKGEAKQIFRRDGYGRGELNWNSGYVDANKSSFDVGDARCPVKRALGRHAPPAVVAVNPETGKVHELYRKTDVEKALVAAGKKTRGGKKVPSSQEKAAETKRRFADQVRTRTNHEVLRLAVEAVEGKDLSDEQLLRGLALAAAHRAWHDTLKVIVTRRGMVPEKKAKGSAGLRPQGAAEKAIAAASPAGLRGWLVEILLQACLPSSPPYDAAAGSGKAASEVLGALGVNRKSIEGRIRKELAAKEAALAKKKKAKAAPKKPKPRRPK